MAGILLFLTYYFQLTLAYSPVKSGLAFLPMVAAIVVASTTSSGVLMPRVGPRPWSGSKSTRLIQAMTTHPALADHEPRGRTLLMVVPPIS